MRFHFVDSNRTDDVVVRRQIRSHVAKGRNAGKKLNRPSRKRGTGSGPGSVQGEDSARPPILTLVPLSFLPTHWKKVQKSRSEGLALIQRAILFIGGLRSFPELNAALDYREELGSLWVQPMFLDEAYFHGAMALFIAGLKSPADNTHATAQAQHMCWALRMINARLSGANAAAKENIAVILTLGMYERYDGNYCRSLVHLDGLQRIVEMRGGIAELARTSPLLTMGMFRADLECSLYLNTPTRFTVRDVEQVTAGNRIISSLSENFTTPSASPLPSSLLVHPVLAALLRQATHISRLLNTASQPTDQKLNSLHVHDTFILLGYRLQALLPLLRVRDGGIAAQRLAAALPTSHRDGSRTEEEALCLGLTAFVVSTLRGGGCGKMNSGPIGWVRDGARSLGRLTSTTIGNSWEWELALWLTFIGVGAQVFHERDIEEWAVPKVTECMAALGLKTWEDVVNVLREWPWVDALHRRAGMNLWERFRALSLHSSGD
ncbi:hypothetical protein C8A03DRAFT_18703 [Achaetomium macrosporum]|uniref:Uncharacterized protein n=1 Tax=Achaetomium macrosporum TaxID=79813 RepID=A0AAN7HB01_9PEZI|nr:hypothetical protein C8A03DRAFT_18703 [Achaetomium macrosporum]